VGRGYLPPHHLSYRFVHLLSHRHVHRKLLAVRLHLSGLVGAGLGNLKLLNFPFSFIISREKTFNNLIHWLIIRTLPVIVAAIPFIHTVGTLEVRRSTPKSKSTNRGSSPDPCLCDCGLWTDPPFSLQKERCPTLLLFPHFQKKKRKFSGFNFFSSTSLCRFLIRFELAKALLQRILSPHFLFYFILFSVLPFDHIQWRRSACLKFRDGQCRRSDYSIPFSYCR